MVETRLRNDDGQRDDHGGPYRERAMTCVHRVSPRVTLMRMRHVALQTSATTPHSIVALAAQPERTIRRLSLAPRHEARAPSAMRSDECLTSASDVGECSRGALVENFNDSRVRAPAPAHRCAHRLRTELRDITGASARACFQRRRARLDPIKASGTIARVAWPSFPTWYSAPAKRR